MEMEKRPGLTDLSAADEGAAISLEPAREQLPQLRMLLSAGAFVRVETGHSLRELICEQFRVSPEYLEQEIKVLFLNYSPVNDMDSAIIKDGAILALCGAMPGLVGAAMRRDGLSSMRSSITYKEEATERVQGEGVIYLKLFNVVMKDLGESFLRRGVYVESRALAEFLASFSGDFWRECKGIHRNGRAITKDGLFHHLSANETWVRYSIH
jgi:hypothetical protein